MKSLAETKLRSFEETLLGAEVRVFGSVAVALAACEMTENGAEVSRGVETLLLIKEEGVWRIASQAWNKETEGEADTPASRRRHDPRVIGRRRLGPKKRACPFCA